MNGNGMTIPSGSVTFLAGSVVLGSSTITNGMATFTTTLAVGTYSIDAVYGGDSTYAGSTSNPLTETVTSSFPRRSSP